MGCVPTQLKELSFNVPGKIGRARKKEKHRATSIRDLTSEQRIIIPTENVVCERYLSTFGRLAGESAAYSYRKFTGKRTQESRWNGKGVNSRPEN